MTPVINAAQWHSPWSGSTLLSFDFHPELNELFKDKGSSPGYTPDRLQLSPNSVP